MITRADAKARDIAIYLDGFEFHASAAHNNLAHDASKRQGVRANGAWVWNLTWDDVTDFHEAVSAAVPKSPAARPLLSTLQRGRAEKLQLERGGAFDLRMVNHNPMQLLLDVLENPDPLEWERLALSAIGGAVSGVSPVLLEVDEIEPALNAVLNGGAIDGTGIGDASAALMFTWGSLQGLPLVALLDVEAPHSAGDERWTVIARIDDSLEAVTQPNHRARWRDYLQWANVLQFVTSSGRAAVITSAADAKSIDVHDFEICPVDDLALVTERAVREQPAKRDASSRWRCRKNSIYLTSRRDDSWRQH